MEQVSKGYTITDIPGVSSIEVDADETTIIREDWELRFDLAELREFAKGVNVALQRALDVAAFNRPAE